jgi:hypothetical protein
MALTEQAVLLQYRRWFNIALSALMSIQMKHGPREADGVKWCVSCGTAYPCPTLKVIQDNCGEFEGRTVDHGAIESDNSADFAAAIYYEKEQL